MAVADGTARAGATRPDPAHAAPPQNDPQGALSSGAHLAVVLSARRRMVARHGEPSRTEPETGRAINLRPPHSGRGRGCRSERSGSAGDGRAAGSCSRRCPSVRGGWRRRAVRTCGAVGGPESGHPARVPHRPVLPGPLHARLEHMAVSALDGASAMGRRSSRKRRALPCSLRAGASGPGSRA